MKKISLLVLMLTAFTCFSQEICNNAIDDDGDGLIDLNDEECLCGQSEIATIIPNASFEDHTQCPYDYSQLYFADGWMQATSATTDYMNTCGFVFGAVTDADLVPFPDGDGIAGAHFMNGWKEYLGCCLSSPMVAGTSYKLSFDIASVPILDSGATCGNGLINYEPVDVTLYGTTSCNYLPLDTTDSPDTASPEWFVLGSVYYIPETEWGVVSIIFTPTVNVNAVMIGAPPAVPPSYIDVNDTTCYPYFIFDDLVLNEASLFGVNITDSGSYCNNDLIITAVPTITLSSSATYQWYKDGVAIIGATDQTFDIEAVASNVASYAVRIVDGANCYVSTPYNVSPLLPTPQYTSTVPTCIVNGSITITTEADLYSFDNGETWSTENTMDDLDPGVHYIKIQNDSGCLSGSIAVTMPYPEYLMSPNVLTVNATCGETGSITILTEAAQYSFNDGETWVTNPVLNNIPAGEYYVRVKDEDGCISEIAYVYIGQNYLEQPLFTTIDPDCSNNNGSITITSSASEYSFDGGLTWVTNPTMNGLSVGQYYLVIKDSEGCISYTAYAYLNQEFLDYATFDYVEGCNDNGSITITTPAAQYSIDGGLTWQETSEFENLSTGYYDIVIQDEEGCISYPNGFWLNEIYLDYPEYVYAQPGCEDSGSITITTEAAEYSFDNGVTWSTDNVLNDPVPYSYYYLMIKNSEDCISYSVELYAYPSETIPDAPIVNPTQPSCTTPEGSISVASAASQYSFDNGDTWGTANNSGPLPGGTYLVKIKNSQGCESPATQVIINDPVNVPDAPQVTVTDPTCSLATGSITVTTGAAFYSFDNGATWVSINTQNNLIPGTYQVKIKNTAGCISSATTVVISSETGPAPLPTATINQPNCNIATGTITITNIVAVEFSFDNGDTWSTQNSMAGLAEGTYYVKIKTAAGCISQALEVIIAMEIVPLPAVGDLDYCQGATALPLTANGANLLWYDSETGGNGSSTAPTPSTATVDTITYYVSQTVNGCESERVSIIVTVWPTPLPPVSGGDFEYCQGEPTVTLTATGTNLLWYTVPEGGTGNAVAPTPPSQTAGMFVYYVSQSLNGCESDRTPITVLIKPTPDEPQTETTLTYEHLDPTLPLSAEGINLTWYDADLNILNSTPVPSSANIGSTTYYVNQTIDGCEGPMVEITVNILPNYIDIEYPKFFSPNGDGMRDTWNIFPPEHGVRATVEIYDRYGKIITVLKAPGAGWDGNYNGRPLPATDYWFKVVYKEYGVEKEFKAHFSLLR